MGGETPFAASGMNSSEAQIADIAKVRPVVALHDVTWTMLPSDLPSAMPALENVNVLH